MQCICIFQHNSSLYVLKSIPYTHTQWSKIRNKGPILKSYTVCFNGFRAASFKNSSKTVDSFIWENHATTLTHVCYELGFVIVCIWKKCRLPHPGIEPQISRLPVMRHTPRPTRHLICSALHLPRVRGMFHLWMFPQDWSCWLRHVMNWGS